MITWFNWSHESGFGGGMRSIQSATVFNAPCSRDALQIMSTDELVGAIKFCEVESAEERGMRITRAIDDPTQSRTSAATRAVPNAWATDEFKGAVSSNCPTKATKEGT